MTPKWSECPSNNCRESFSCENGEWRSCLTDAVPLSTSYFALPSANRMCSLSAQKKDGHVYKRRKMDKDSNLIVADEMKETTARSFTVSEDHPLMRNLSELSVTPPDATISNLRVSNVVEPTLEYEEPAKASLEPNSGVNDRQSVRSMPSFLKLDKRDAVKCSSSNIRLTEPITELTSARDLCIAVLTNDGLLNGSQTRITAEEFIDNDANKQLACKTCGCLEHPLKMLICDSCEAAFHLSCCIPRIKELPTDEWYCLPCLRKKPKSNYGKLLDGKVKPSGNIGRRPHGMTHIEYMLKDIEPYVTGVRIGRDFQVDVPEWSGPTSSIDDYFEEPSELDHSEYTNLNWWKMNNQNKSSIGNWIQCQELLNAGDSDGPVVCGKWRRAPLFVVQSDDWDCSCCVLWDPVHADCSVLQELDTDEVLKQLKYVNVLKNQLVDRNHQPA